jgi:glycosyltransferase involved in cell wall biosynthesis
MLIKKKISIAHVSTVHPRFDTRIFRKMASSLVGSGYQVYIIVADGKGDECLNGIKIIDIGRPHSRLMRMIKSTQLALEVVRKLNVDIAHLHDPELLLIADSLMNSGMRVIFDSHEDVPSDLRFKPYLNELTRVIASSSYGWLEAKIVKRIDGVIGATSEITRRLKKYNERCVTINNFPIIGELADDGIAHICKNAVYIGAIDYDRGISQLVNSFDYVKSGIMLDLCGEFSETHCKNTVENLGGWRFVNYHGYITRVQARKLLAESCVGVVTFLPTPNHLISLPNKLFEYLSASKPVLCSNFDHWIEIIKSYECGLTVDPNDSRAIAEALDFFAKDPYATRKMGLNGWLAVEAEYNWEKEYLKLCDFYEATVN